MTMRVRITETLSGEVDGFPLSRLMKGNVYDVGTTLGCYLLASGAAVPVTDEAPALLLPLDEEVVGSKVSARHRPDKRPAPKGRPR